MIHKPRRRMRATVLGMSAAAGIACAGSAPAPETSPSAIPASSSNGRRAILVSFDSFSERRMIQSLPAESIPAIRVLFSNGACAAYAQPAFPSLTAPGHASVWTGAYGDVSGITANNQPRLPLDEHTLLENISGFSFAALRAEPLWLTAGRAGVSVVGHHVTQAPGPPGYPSVYGAPDDSLLALREAAARDIRLPAIALLNGYNRRLSGDTVLTERATPPRAANAWRNLEALASGVPPLEIAWLVGADSIFAVLHGERAYDRITVARLRDARLAVTAPAAGPDTTALSGRPLARFYSAPIPLSVDDGVAHLVVRLFSLSADGSRFELFMPEVNVVQANLPDVAAAYGSAVGGWVGNAAASLLRRGGFGRRLTNGGIGGAEARWLDAAEYLTRQSMRGAEWAWHGRGAAMLLDYFPLGDEADHMFYGEVAPGVPGWAEYDREAIARVRIRAWELVDRRLGGLLTLVDADSSAILVVTGDHGMRPTWRLFRPNAALAEAGLLVRGANGQPDLARTRALTPNGDFISINTIAHRGGIVPLDSAAAIRAAAERALRAVRGENGEPVVTGVWDAEEIDTLGVGGPAGGDLYFELAPGYRSTRGATGAVTEAASLDAGHGFLSTSPDMHTVLCAYGPRVGPHRSAPARTIDAAPTISEWLGMPAPRDSRGRSRLGELLGRPSDDATATVVNVGHRGASGRAPEHTFAAYDLALTLGADYIEQDLQLTQDGILVALHDPTLDRTARGSAANCSGRVIEKSLAQIKTCDVGRWFNERFPEYARPEYEGLTIPTLEEVFQRYGHRARYYIETKNPDESPGMEEALLRLMARYDLRNPAAERRRVLIQSFSAASLRRIHTLDATLPLIRLFPNADSATIHGALDQVREYAVGIGPAKASVDPALVEAAHARCLVVHPYTVNELPEMRALVALGVDGMFTNFPERLEQLTGDSSGKPPGAWQGKCLAPPYRLLQR